jgi:hypothetical protein
MKSLDLAVRPVAAEIAAHRANRERKRGAFPKEIWDKVVALAQSYGVVRVAKAAKVDGRSIRAHLEILGPPASLNEKPASAATEVNVEPRDGRASQTFVECLVDAARPDHSAWTIEVESALGDRMRIQAPSLKSSDLPLLMRGFLGR